MEGVGERERILFLTSRFLVTRLCLVTQIRRLCLEIVKNAARYQLDLLHKSLIDRETADKRR
jgi:hypothetical protein